MTRIPALVVAVLPVTAGPALVFAGEREEANKKAVVGPRYVKFPRSRGEIKRVFADGDYVTLHVHAVRTPGERGSAIVDIFKLENGKIVEH